MRGAITAVLAWAAVAAAAQAQPGALSREGELWVETSSGAVTAAEVNRLRVAVRGDVKLEGEPGGRISYVYRKRVQARSEEEARRMFAGQQLRVTREGDRASLLLAEDSWSLVRGELVLRVPARLKQYSIETRIGGIEATGLDGELIAESGGGRIEVERLRGDLTAVTAGGPILLGLVEGTARATSGGGMIQARRLAGEAWLETAGGGILVEEAGGPVHASTGAGNIEVKRAEAAVSARTLGGLIKVGRAGGMVSAETREGGIHVSSTHGLKLGSGRGAIRLTGVSGMLSVSAAMGSILADLRAGRPLEDSLLSTSSGDITVLIPSNLAVRVQAWNAGGARPGWIVSEFAEIQPEARGGQGSAMASGELNGGGPLLRIAVSGGTIYLRQSK